MKALVDHVGVGIVLAIFGLLAVLLVGAWRDCRKGKDDAAGP